MTASAPGSTSDDFDRLYVERPAEEREALRNLDEPGKPVLLVGAAGIGRRWLGRAVIRRRSEAQPALRHCVVDFASELGQGPGADVFRLVADRCAQSVGIAEGAAADWRRPSPPPARLTSLVERRVLAGGPFLLALANVDALLAAPSSDDFFVMLRSWSERGSSSPVWRELRLLATLAVQPNELIRTTHASPFNLSRPIEVRELDGEQVVALARRRGRDWSSDDAAAVIELVGGRPGLLGRLIDCLPPAPPPGALRGLLRDEGLVQRAFGEHLARLQERLGREPALRRALALVPGGGSLPRAEAASLQSAGVVVVERGVPRLRCALYQRLLRPPA